MRKLKNYKPTRFMAETSHYSKQMADFAVMFIEQLTHTKGTWAGKPFELIDWQERIIRDLFGVLKPNGYRQFNTAYIEIPKKMGKSELAAAVALLLCCGDGEERAEVYGCAADRQQATIVFDVAADMVRMCPALNRRVKILASQKRIIYEPTNSFYQVLSAEAYSKHGFNIHGVVFDELHTQPNRKLFDVMTKGSGDARMQPLYFLITTAGNDTNTISCNHCFAQMVFCGDCGELYRRVHWNNHGCKSIVWRCISRLEPTSAEMDCTNRTVNELLLQEVTVKAFHQILTERDFFLKTLQQNIAKAVVNADTLSPDGIQARLEELQKELIKKANNKQDYDAIADEIFRLRDQKEQSELDSHHREEAMNRIKELQDFISGQETDITEFDEALVKKLIEKITVFNDHFTVEFKSGITIDIES